MAKRIIFILVLFISGAVSLSAQHRGGKDHGQMMKEMWDFKLKYLAQEMELQDDQKERFFQLYNEMSEKRRQCMTDAWKLDRKVKKSENASEKDYEAAAEAMEKAKAEDASIEKSYDEKFSRFLSQKQIYKMKAADNEFRKKLQEMRRKRGKK